MAVKLTRVIIEIQVRSDNDDDVRVATHLAHVDAAKRFSEADMEPVNTDTRVVEETYDNMGPECKQIATPRVIVAGYAGID